MEVKKERIRLETLEIPDIPEDDIVEVITNVKELLQKRAVKKYESSILKSLRLEKYCITGGTDTACGTSCMAVSAKWI